MRIICRKIWGTMIRSPESSNGLSEWPAIQSRWIIIDTYYHSLYILINAIYFTCILYFIYICVTIHIITICLYILYIVYEFFKMSQSREERRLQSCRPIGEGTGELSLKISQFWDFYFCLFLPLFNPQL